MYLWAKAWDKTIPDFKLPIIKKEDDTKMEKEDSSNSASNSDHSYIKGSTFGDVALQSMLVPPVNELKIKQEDMKTSIIQDDMKIKSQSELISILEDGTDKKCIDSKSDNNNFPKIDLNTMISNSLEIKSEIKSSDDENKENTLNSITSGLLGSSTIDLQLSQSDLERLSSLAQLTDVAVAQPQPQPNIPQPEAAIDSSDCRMNLLEHIEYFQNLVDEKLNLMEAEISGIFYTFSFT